MKSYKALLLFLISAISLNFACSNKKESKESKKNTETNSYSGFKLQILGSGGPEFSKRASSSYIIWIDNKAKILIDAGSGAFMRFSESGAKIEDLDFIALTHLHIDHSADIAAFMKAGYFSKRTQILPILGTTAAGNFPDIKTFLVRMFGSEGVYAYMQDILTPETESFQIKAKILPQELTTTFYGDTKVSSIGVHHGVIPAIAFAIEIEGKKIVFAGDTNAETDKLVSLSKNADYLIVHHAIPEHAGNYAKRLHITPSRIGELAQQVNVKNLVLSHRMTRTLDKEEETTQLIRANYTGEIIWANDMLVLKIK